MKNSTIFLFLIFIFSNSFSQSKNFIDQPYIETEAQVDSLVVPDRIYMTITLNEADSKNKKSTEQLENQMNRVLKSIGIDIKKDLSLLDFSSDFKKYFLSSQKVQKIKMFSLLVRDAKTVGRVLVGLEKAKISNVTIEKAEYSKAEELILSLKSKAILKAKKNAESVSKPLGQEVGKAIFISDFNSVTNAMQGKAAGVVLTGTSRIYANRAKETNFVSDFKKLKFLVRLNVKFKLE